jgi:hypothetical protein
MPFQTLHDVPRGIARLLSAPRDLPPSAPWLDPPIAKSAAAPQHLALFAQYTEFLGDAMAIAEDWWQALIQGHLDEGKDRTRALEDAYERRYAGPASCPEIVWTLRKFWLDCVALNRTLTSAQQVPPEVFLLHWLDDGRHQQWIQVLSAMPYWPIGLDATGNWV